MITEKQYEKFIKERIGRLYKIGNIHDAIKSMKELGYDDLREMTKAIDNDHGLGMLRIGHTYYYTEG